MDYDAAANYAIMNQLCKVCGEPAAGFHFGAFTCEGCKSFFGRTYNNISSISECKNNGKCVINKKNRTACKACRLRKCMMVGMSKSGSRYGRRSNWFKIHCLLQQQQQQPNHNHHPVTPFTHQSAHAHDVAAANLAAAASLLRPNPYLSPLFRNQSNAPMVPLPGMRDTVSNCESDSGASSADLEEENRSGSALSYLRPSGSPLSDRIGSDTECFLKTHAINNKTNLLLNNNNNNNHVKSPSLRPPAPPNVPSPASLPAISPNPMLTPSPNPLHRFIPPPFPLINDPGIWRELWLRSQPTVAEQAPDQDQPIDLSVKQCKKTDGQESREEECGLDTREVGEGKTVGIPLDLTLALDR